jgi:hypothetical protein
VGKTLAARTLEEAALNMGLLIESAPQVRFRPLEPQGARERPESAPI